MEDGKIGCMEIVMYFDNLDIFYVGFYYCLCIFYYYISGGELGGVFKSEDGGKSWWKLSKGFFIGFIGMIDLFICWKVFNVIVGVIEVDENLLVGVFGFGVYCLDDGGESWIFLYKYVVCLFYYG